MSLLALGPSSVDKGEVSHSGCHVDVVRDFLGDPNVGATLHKFAW